MPDLNEEFNKPTDTGGTPVTEFVGVLKDIRMEETEYQGKKRVRVAHDFIECEIISSTEPYTFPIVKFNTTYDNRVNTRWTVERESINRIIPIADDGRRDIYQLKDKRQRWSRLIPCKISAPDPDNTTGPWIVQDIPYWQLIQCEGFSKANSNGMTIWEGILSLITAPITEAELSAKVFNAHEIKNLPGFSEAVTLAADRAIGKQLEAMGMVRAEGDKWSKI